MTINTYVEQMHAANPNVDRDQLRQQFEQLMSWEALKEPTIALILEGFKPDELKAINKFFKTPAGSAYADKSPWLSSELSKIILANASKYKPPISELDKQLAQIANEANKSFPTTLDEETRIDNTVGGNGQFTYNYTLTSYTADQLDAQQLNEILRADLVNAYCTSEGTKFFKDNKVPINYSYSGKNGNHIVSITTKPSDC